jgi:hypothetical protein
MRPPFLKLIPPYDIKAVVNLIYKHYNLLTDQEVKFKFLTKTMSSLDSNLKEIYQEIGKLNSP